MSVKDVFDFLVDASTVMINLLSLIVIISDILKQKK